MKIHVSALKLRRIITHNVDFSSFFFFFWKNKALYMSLELANQVTISFPLFPGVIFHTCIHACVCVGVCMPVYELIYP